MFWDFLYAVFLFGLVLVLAWFTTRFVGLRMGAPARGRSLRVLEHIPAGRDRSVMLLEVGGRVYLVGATAQQINLIDAIDDPETIGRILEQAETPAQAMPLGVPIAIPESFSQMLAKVREKIAPAQPSAPPEQPAAVETERLREQMERLRRLQQKE